MKRAYIAIRDAPLYRREAFVAGLKTLGIAVYYGRPEVFDADTAFVCWNRYFENHDACGRLEAAGGAVVVAENGYLLPGGGSPHHQPIREWFALARNYHNDEAEVEYGGPSRWESLGIEMKPWREDGGHILVCPNRSFGTPGRYMPIHWGDEVAARLRRVTKREVRVRPHPGNAAPARPLAADLEGAWATVIWTSSAGVHSLLAGVPVISEAAHWIAKSVAGESIAQIEAPPMRERLPAFRRLAWANWSLAEIQSGEALGYVLRRDRQSEVRAAD